MAVTAASLGLGQKGERESRPAHSLPRQAGTGPAQTTNTPFVSHGSEVDQFACPRQTAFCAYEMDEPQ